ncbi:MAG: hypothetical protein J6X87_06310, partial [Clostridia bacterium]|nr:hypothetical protein [Clostridia bacterium]
MKNSSTKHLTLIRVAVLLLATALCVVFGACAKTPDKPVPTEAPQDATEVPAPTDTPVPTEAPTAAPTPEPTPNPYEGMPVPYFDLAFDKGVAYDARDINELEVYGG